MVVDWLLVALGLALLVAGGELLVRGATRLAVSAGVAPAVIGLTIVAAGTSAPELVVSIRGALDGNPGIAVGNVVGSNIFNIGAVLGMAAIVRPLRIQGATIRLEWPVMMLSAGLFHLLASDLRLDRADGGILAGGLLAFLGYLVWMARSVKDAGERATLESLAPQPPVAHPRRRLLVNLAVVGGGVVLLSVGAGQFVGGASRVADGLGVSDTVIGLTVVAAGTSAPELVTTLMAALRCQDDIAVGNVIGSNIFNALGIAGTTALIEPLAVAPEVLARDNLWMLGASLLLFPLIWTGRRISRAEGALLLAGFCAYTGLLIARA